MNLFLNENTLDYNIKLVFCTNAIEACNLPKTFFCDYNGFEFSLVELEQWLLWRLLGSFRC
jgi:hypothetical protein